MVKTSRVVGLALATLCLVGSVHQANAGTITQWSFNTTGNNNSPAPEIGSGTATPLGMSNSYTLSTGNTITGSGTFTPGSVTFTSSTTAADITATAGDPSGDANAWRVRGNGNGGGNGWALQAPQYSQGAQFSSSTAGYHNIGFSFDWFSTTAGVKNMQEQYTLDGTTWTNIGSVLTAVSNGWHSTVSTDFSSITGANDNANFGVRLVSVYDTTLAFPNYGSADGLQSGYYNNNSGNWRFAAVTFTGTQDVAAVPEPSSFALLTLGGLGLAIRGYRRRQTSV